MIRFGYDFYEDGSIQKPNGLIGQKITEKNKDTSNIFQLYLPPYLTEMFKKFYNSNSPEKPATLKDADIFMKLFDATDSDDMDYSMQKSDNIYTIFSDFDITYKSWSKLLRFLTLDNATQA